MDSESMVTATPTGAAREPVVRGAGAGRVLTLRPGDVATLLLVSEDTGGAQSVGEYAAQPASAGPPPHVHPDADETFYVLEGEFTFGVGERTIRASAGTVVFVPRGVLHSVANLGTAPARLLYVYAPAGIERFWEELMATQSARGPLDAATIRAIAARHGTIQVPPPATS